MFSHEGVGGILMWNFDNEVCCGTDSNVVDSETLEPNLAGETYLRYSVLLNNHNPILHMINDTILSLH